MCSDCGRGGDKPALDARSWVRPCGSVHGRDVIAAENIRAAGRADLNDRGARVGPAPVPAQGGDAVTHRKLTPCGRSRPNPRHSWRRQCCWSPRWSPRDRRRCWSSTNPRRASHPDPLRPLAGLIPAGAARTQVVVVSHSRPSWSATPGRRGTHSSTTPAS
ncbi:hypothetical protein [Micromonospora sp. NPDC000018]|uniref:hypothetical protein n=1 Tax=Micromonospora sp. NPDC000018 TaxID=3154239 RepID=UPI00332051F9